MAEADSLRKGWRRLVAQLMAGFGWFTNINGDARGTENRL
jgi:hypothetical protein